MLTVLLLFASQLFSAAGVESPVLAQIVTPTPTSNLELGASRKTSINIPFTSYQWWLIRYSNNQIVCSFSVEHEGLPTPSDVLTFCDQRVYNEWVTTEPCNQAEVSALNACPGFYLHLVSSAPGERPIEIDLPVPSAWVSIANCNPQPADRRCTTLPTLLINGEEPLPNENIISIQGDIGGEPFRCMGETCSIPLRPTGTDGVMVTFWADSSFGDSTPHYTARVRLVPWGDFMNPEQNSTDQARWYVDVLSNRWRDGKLATCSGTWDVFPPIGGMPDWLTSPENSADLQSDTSYYYLAGSLITFGVVDASTCLDGGLQAPNIASPCGVEAARPKLVEWQNRFDEDIMSVSLETGVPARLLKNVFARESQIWPGIYTTYKEAGLGQLTSNGADTVLLWNDSFFRQFCPLVLDKKYCEANFWELGDAEKEMLRGALVNNVNASCPGCPAGIDLSQAQFSVRVFAEGMLANCEQVSQSIYNITGLMPGQVSTYEDLWRFTLVNYNGGSGCLYDGVVRAWIARRPIDWLNVSENLDPVCQGSVGYVEDISRMLKPSPTPTAWLPLGTSQPTPILPRVLFTPTPTGQPFTQATATATITATPTPSITPSSTPGLPIVTVSVIPSATPSQTHTPTEISYP
jgi:hypothetical protein